MQTGAAIQQSAIEQVAEEQFLVPGLSINTFPDPQELANALHVGGVMQQSDAAQTAEAQTLVLRAATVPFAHAVVYVEHTGAAMQQSLDEHVAAPHVLFEEPNIFPAVQLTAENALQLGAAVQHSLAMQAAAAH